MTTQYTDNFQLALPDFRMGPWHDLVNNDFKRIDALITGSMSLVRTPNWANNYAYIAGMTAFDPSSHSTWMCSVSHTSAVSGTFLADRTAHPTYWVQMITGFSARGEWKNNTHYFPYDLAYQTTTGVFALCKTDHVSNVGGTIVTDKVYWTFIVDFSSIPLSTATVVTYNNSTSGIPSTNVQGAIDWVKTQLVALDNVNVTQGANITSLQSKDTTHETRMTAIESKNTTQDTTLTSLQNQINANKLTYSPVNKVGDTMTGKLHIQVPVSAVHIGFISASRSLVILNDPTYYYITMGDGGGIPGALDCIRIKQSDGTVTICGAGQGTTIGGALQVNNALSVSGNMGVNGAASFYGSLGANTLSVVITIYAGSQISSGLGYRTKVGSTGSLAGNSFNFNWAGSQMQGYIDDTLVGNVCDPRVKWDIQDFTVDAVALVKQLKPVSFRFRNIGIFEDDGKRHVGLLADNVHSVIPEATIGELNAVTANGSVQPVNLDWLPLVTLLVEAVQDLTKRVEQLEKPAV